MVNLLNSANDQRLCNATNGRWEPVLNFVAKPHIILIILFSIFILATIWIN